LINDLTPYYKHFIETLQITDKLSTAIFYSLGELLAQHSKSFGKKKNLVRIFSSLVQTKKKVQKEEELRSIIEDKEIKFGLLIEDVAMGIVKEEKVIIFNEDQTVLE